MNTEQLKEWVKNSFLFIAGFIDLTLLLRIILKLIGASSSSSFVNAIYNLTEPFFLPFEGTLGNPEAGPVVFEIDSIVAMITYGLLGFFFFKLINAIFEETMTSRLHEMVDLFFKLSETVLVYRLIFKMFGVSGSYFLNMLYVISEPFYMPFKGLLPSLEYGNFAFETATFIAIILLIIMDVVTENLFVEIKRRSKPTKSKVKIEAKKAEIKPQKIEKTPQTQRVGEVENLSKEVEG